MLTRKKFLAFLATLPFARVFGQSSEPREPEIVIPESAKKRIAKILAEGGKISQIHWYHPDPQVRTYGQLFFNKDEERDWQLKSTP